MSERETFPHGVPCWVDVPAPDPDAARNFYGAVLGWEFDGPGEMPGDPSGEYWVARLRGRDVAGVSSMPAQGLPGWNTYVRVDSADAAAVAVREAGGEVTVEPFDVPPAGRLAVVADPGGATFCVWEAGVREGAKLVNEPSAWSMSALHTADPETVMPFYRAAFGWEAEAFGPPEAGFWIWRLPGFVGGEPEQPVPRDVVATMARADEEAPSWRPDFWIADVDRAAAAAAEHGGSAIEGPADVPGIPFRSAVLEDGAGAVFSLSQLLVEGSGS